MYLNFHLKTHLLVESSFKIPYYVSTCHLCMQHNGCIGKLYFSTLPSVAYTKDTTSSNVYVLRQLKGKWYM